MSGCVYIFSSLISTHSLQISDSSVSSHRGYASNLHGELTNFRSNLISSKFDQKGPKATAFVYIAYLWFRIDPLLKQT